MSSPANTTSFSGGFIWIIIIQLLQPVSLSATPESQSANNGQHKKWRYDGPGEKTRAPGFDKDRVYVLYWGSRTKSYSRRSSSSDSTNNTNDRRST